MMFSLITSAFLLAPAVFARSRHANNGEPLSERSRITAFVVNSEGEPSIECWDMSSMTSSMDVQRKDGSSAAAHAWTLSDRDLLLQGVDILTWPTGSDIWPPSDSNDLHSDSFDMSESYTLFNVQGGLLNIFVTPSGDLAGNNARASAGSELEEFVFSNANGDDWFYFEDDSSPNTMSRDANTNPYPIHISTISASETELLRLTYKAQPKHTVVHKGACSFNGIKTSGAHESSESGHSGFTVQVNIDDL